MQPSNHAPHLQASDILLHVQATDRDPEGDSNNQADVHSLSGSQQLQEAGRASASTGPSLSLGQRMKKSQASWRPLPVSACPLTPPAPSEAAYPLPQQAKQAAACLVPQQAKQARLAMLPDQTSLGCSCSLEFVSCTSLAPAPKEHTVCGSRPGISAECNVPDL